MDNFRGFKALLCWRQDAVGTRDPHILELCLTCEGLPDDAIHVNYVDDVRRWRKLRTVERQTLCIRFCDWLKEIGV